LHTLTIGAASLASARGFLDSLDGFQAETCRECPGTYEVRITLDGRRIREALHAIDKHVRKRDAGPVHVDFDGQRYRLEPDSATAPGP
jgi:hypothetical protein